MKKTAFLLFLAIVFSVPSWVKADANTPICQFETTKYDFGNIAEGQIASYTFTFKNVGSAPLLVSDVEKACGLKSVAWTKESVSPGNTGFVTVNFNSNDRPGMFRRTIVVKTNMGDDKDILLLIKGNVLTGDAAKQITPSGEKVNAVAQGAKIAFNEDSHNFGKIQEGDVATYEFKFQNTGNQPLYIAEAKIAGVNFSSIDFPKSAIQPGTYGIVKVSVNTKGHEGSFNHSILVKTNDPITETKELVVKGKVKK